MPTPRETLSVGRYRLHRRIAAGGMASVHLGRLRGSAGFARVVAIKRLHPEFARDPLFVETLLDEARLVSRIHHPNVVPVLDLVAEGPETLVVMEYVHGVAASTLIERCHDAGRPIPVPIAVAIMDGALHGLQAAHEAVAKDGTPLGLVHRDVSPQNILVSAEGVALITDFGIAKAAGRAQLTKTGEIKGKLAYMAPEQLAAAEVSPRTDVYAAGIVMWELLAGRRLFDGASEAEVYAKLVQRRIPLLREIVPELPPALEAVVGRALSYPAEERPASARELASALRAAAPVATRSDVAAFVESLASDRLAERDAWLLEMERPKEEPVRRRGWPLVLGALTLAAAGLWMVSTSAPASTARIAGAPFAQPTVLPKSAVHDNEPRVITIAPSRSANSTSTNSTSTSAPPAPPARKPAMKPCRRLGADGIWRIEQCPVRR